MLQRSVWHLRLVKECGWEEGAREAWSEVEGGGLHLVHHQALNDHRCDIKPPTGMRR